MQAERSMDMTSKHFNRYYLFSCVGVLLASYYPLSMGVRVITDMIKKGTVIVMDNTSFHRKNSLFVLLKKRNAS